MVNDFDIMMNEKEVPVDIKNREIPAAELRPACDPAEFPFTTTAELSLRDEVIGQKRAVKAIEFGISIRNHGYNIFVSGSPGHGQELHCQIHRQADLPGPAGPR